MAEQYYIRARGKVQGPFDTERLKVLAKRGRFSRSFEVSSDGVTWSRAAGLPHLFPEPPRLPKQGAAARHAAAEAASPIAQELPEFAQSPATEFTLEMADPLAGSPLVERDWFYAQDQQELGPVTQTQLEAMIASGQLAGGDQVWTEGMSGWVPAGQVEALMPFVEQAAQARAPYGQPSWALADQAYGPGPHAPLSIASVVLAILGLNVLYLLPFAIYRQQWIVAAFSSLFYIASVVAVVFGHLALRAIRLSYGQLTGRGMVIAGLCLGYLVVILVTTAVVVAGLIVAFGGRV
ncbi:MAG TPA: GYF domain-containing protein, partial [Planctomycetaceae bacterium]